ncbi:MAG: hypothetical protein GY847_20550 [Proteobacteria bacterium]|nr:hypothetical protein [Pseudomonadota bacterium]
MNYDKVLDFKSELVGLYFKNLFSGVTLPPNQASAQMDTYGWTSGWRLQDTEDQTIWNGGCPKCLFRELSMFFIIDTKSMTIRSYRPIGVEDIFMVIEEIDRETQ